ncbi:TolC family protein [Flavivirga abyssicola]|uniref:TolC family protein n=1 Tax=Flavivirga abyssicola TaxID=3063533 RepID=UPI0026DFD74C|nr:TolC family protein [Flavivirga sp. MEBiC07777]WVK14184.1 TolC family protein [Flavivirga sp. MEBiC07777]
MRSIILSMLCGCVLTSVFSQGDISKTITLSLDDAVELAKNESINYLTAKNNSEVNYWEYQSYKSGFLPSLSINGILPNYQRSINRITVDDGTDLFIEQNQAFSSLSLDVNQIVSFTGGEFRVSSSLNRIDILSNPTFNTYSSTPLTIGYFQENIFYNPYKWQKKIQPLIFEESKRELIEELEEISLQATSKFFDFLLAKIKSENASNNKANQDTIYNISKGRFNLGKLYENDLLQSELSLLNAEKELIVSKNELKLTKQSFLDELGIKGDEKLELLIPENLIFVKIDSMQLFEKALENRKLLIEHNRKVIEAEQNVAKTKSDGFKIGITGNFGLTQQDELLSEAYSGLLVQQNFSFTFSAPIFSWGKRKSERKIAIANLDLIKSINEQELMSVKRELSLKYLEWQQIELSVRITKKASEISLKRYSATKRRFVIGKVSITDLIIAQNEKDIAIYNYYENLREYWELYYELRKLTLYDFIKKENIQINISHQ